jgi:DNA-binding protein YbaB
LAQSGPLCKGGATVWKKVFEVDERMPAAAGASDVAAQLREQSARLSAAAMAAGAVTCDAKVGAGGHGEVSVTATGRGEVTRVYVGPRAMRSGPAALAATLCRLLNRAVQGARERAAHVTLDAVDPSLRAALRADTSPPGDAVARFAAQLAGQAVSSHSPDGKVTVTASGTGEILAVQFSAAARDGSDSTGLAEQVTAAASGALDAARNLQQQLMAGQRDNEATIAAALDSRLAAFNGRMDELLDQLDRADRRISDLE